MTDDLLGAGQRPAEVILPAAIQPDVPAPLEQISSGELAELRRRADKYRFLFRTIVTVTGILVAATLVVVLAALLIDN